MWDFSQHIVFEWTLLGFTICFSLDVSDSIGMRNAVAGMFMVELQFYTRYAETVFTAACAVSKHKKRQINNELTCCREVAWCFLLSEILLSHSRSVKVIRNYCVELGMCKFLIMLYHFWVIQCQIMVCPWNLGYGSFQVTENGTIW